MTTPTLLALSALALASPALAQTYHLRAPSNITEQCSTGCTCDTQRNEPLRGRFTLSLTASDPSRDSFSIDSLVMYGTNLSQTYTGGGTYIVGTGLPGEQRTSADVAINRLPAFHSDYARRVYLRHTTIDTIISLPTSACSTVTLDILSTPFVSDWNADGTVSTSDIFDFINAWFAGDGDTDEDGSTTTADIFAFINAWLAGA
jgi:hypothetical protein